jgi:putative intracellular protease/amidase
MFGRLRTPNPRAARRATHRSHRNFSVEKLESRHLMAADPLPVLMVLADQRDFYYQEYGDTRLALEAAGLEVDVAATTTDPTFPHAGTGEGAGSGMVTPDLTLAQVDAADYSAIVFVGGWGASMYQYAWPGDYANDHYDGNTATKAIVNDLIGDFVDQDKYVAAICHGVTVLAWARVDGVSPLSGRTVSVPWIGSPGGLYQGQWYGYYELKAYPQVVDNGATANQTSGAYGDPTTAADDVVVDGRIITAENYDSASLFGTTIAEHVIADAPPDEPPPAPVFLAGSDLLVQGTPGDDTIYLWTRHTGQLFAWLNGQQFGPYTLPAGGRAIVYVGDGNDRVYATDSHLPVRIFGEAGHDQITGGYADDFVDGGSGVDCVWGGPGNDVLLGGSGNDHLDGREGDDLVAGGDGDDAIAGFTGRDVLLGGLGYDRMDGGAGEDLLIGGRTDYDADELALLAILGEWRSSADIATRMNRLAGGIAGGIRLSWGETVHDDASPDCLNGAGDADWLFLLASECRYYVTPSDRVTSH